MPDNGEPLPTSYLAEGMDHLVDGLRDRANYWRAEGNSRLTEAYFNAAISSRRVASELRELEALELAMAERRRA